VNLRPDQLAAQLERPLAPLWLLHGNEPLLVLEAADAIRAAARRQGYEERETLVVGQGFKWDALALAAGNLSLFGGAKLIDLRIPDGKPGRDGGDALQRYIAHLPSQALTLVTLPEVDWATRKTAWFKALGEAGDDVELNAPERERLPEWVARRLAAQQAEGLARGPRLHCRSRRRQPARRPPGDPQARPAARPGALTLEQVQDAVLNVARYDVDKLRWRPCEGDPARCARLLEGLEGEGAAPPLVLWALATRSAPSPPCAGATPASPWPACSRPSASSIRAASRP
jgi:DNA polymerase-3 subunit delta